MNHRRRCGWLGFVALAAVPAMGTTAKAAPTIVGDLYQETTFTQSLFPPDPGNCTGANYCYFVFSRVPINKLLIVTNVSCVIYPSSAGDLYLTKLVPLAVNGQQVQREHHFAPVRTSTNPNAFIVNAAMSQLIREKGASPDLRDWKQSSADDGDMHDRRQVHQRAVATTRLLTARSHHVAAG
jgi:hypothetical protein